jgi:cyclopropane fatty-acyl-phospholipid synthase-like methyltransferase
MKIKYNKDYYENGLAKGLSCYENYRWIPELTYPMAHTICSFLKIKKNDKVLEYGCAHGFLVKALNDFKIETYGVDISSYALSKVDTGIKKKTSLLKNNNIKNSLKKMKVKFKFDYIISKDVFEHIEPKDLKKILREMSTLTKELFVVVPLGDNGKYRIASYAEDKTHIIAENENWWKKFFVENKFKVKLFSYNIEGIKDKWYNINPRGNGFFKLVPNK